MRLRAKTILILVASLCITESAVAGILLGGGLHWQVFSLRPQATSEPVHRYYGYGPQLALGYSFEQIFDLAGFMRSTGGQLKAAKIGGQDASLLNYGVQVALRLGKVVYLGLQGGPLHYKLHEAIFDTEASGEWSGIGASFAVGAFNVVGKEHMFQTNIFVSSGAIKHEGGAERKIDSFGLAIDYYLGSKG